jgi:hypothetical protein
MYARPGVADINSDVGATRAQMRIRGDYDGAD